MLKNIFSIVLIGVSISCTNQKPESQKQAFGEDVAKEEGTVFEADRVRDENRSTIYFENAVNDFEQGKIADVAKDLRQGANVLVNEGQFLKGEARNRLDYVIGSLETLATNVEKGTEKNITEIERVISEAQLSVAHEYVVDLDEFSVTEPLPDSYYPHFKSAMRAIENASHHLKGTAKEAADALVTESKGLIDELDAVDNVTDEQMRTQLGKMRAFLKQHQLHE